MNRKSRQNWVKEKTTTRDEFHAQSDGVAKPLKIANTKNAIETAHCSSDNNNNPYRSDEDI